MKQCQRLAIAIVSGGVLLRLMLLALLGRRPLAGDAYDYSAMADELASGASFEPDWPPGLPYYLRPFHALFRLFGDSSPLADRFAMLLVYVGFSWVLFRLSRLVAGERAALLALAIFAVFPSYVYLSVTPLTQLLTALLLLAACWIALELDAAPNRAGRGWRASLLGGVLVALLLVRPSNVFLCLLAPLALGRVTRRLAVVVAPALVIALVLGAWTLRAHTLSGRWVFVNNGNSQNLFYGNNPWTPLYRTWWFGSHKQGEPGVPDGFIAGHAELRQKPATLRDQSFTGYALEHVKARPDLFVVRSLSRVRTFFAFDTFTGAQIGDKGASVAHKALRVAVTGADAAFYLAIAALALAWFFVPGERRAAWIFGFAIVLYAIPYFVCFAHPTYHFPVVPLLGIAASARLTSDRPFLPARHRIWFWIAAAGFVLVQAEWTLNMMSRL